MTKLIPLEDHILVEAIQEENTSKSGIIMPESKEKPNKGKVISVGPGKILDNGERGPMDLKEGDVVYFTTYSPDELTANGEKYLILKQSSVLAKEG